MHPVPVNEHERLAELFDTRLLDSGVSPEFEAVVELAQALFETPMAMISLLGPDRQWFKAHRGMTSDHTPRQVAICNHTILRSEPLVLPDAREDPRFCDNPLVTAEKGIRFYAGIPLEMTPGLPLGTLCVLDHAPRTAADVTPAQMDGLKRLATVTVALIRAFRAAATAEAARAELERQRRMLQRRERRFLQTERLAHVGGWEVDLRTGAMEWSEQMYRMAGIEQGASVDGATAMELYLPSERERMQAAIRDAILNRASIDEEFEMVSRDGTRKWVRHIGEAEFLDDRAIRLFGIAQDVSERHADQQRLWMAANTDSLTGLYNRKRYREMLAEFETQALRDGGSVGLLVIDVDHLKEVNDSLGHHSGDILIKAVAERMREACGDAAIACRLGGDEFTVVVPQGATMEGLRILAERLIAAVGVPLDHEGQRLTPSVSIGGAIASGEALQGDGLRRDADLALYHAKETRRGSFAPFDAQLRTAIARRIEDVRVVNDCLARDDLVPWYQPVINLTNGRIEGFEALARLKTTDGRIRSAGEFLTAINDSRVGTRLSTALFTAVAADLADWRRRGLDVGRIGLNVTLADLVDGSLEERLEAIFGAADVPLTKIVVEVTEGVFLNQSSLAVARTLERLRSRGVIVSLDDFGTGYASLTHLRTLPVDTIKIDRSFVERIATDRPSDAIVGLLVELGRRLGVDVVAEGVESVEQMERLIRIGCPFGQGYLFSRPLPRRDVLDFYAAFRFPEVSAAALRRINLAAG